jgi:hypothetical protein
MAIGRTQNPHITAFIGTFQQDAGTFQQDAGTFQQDAGTFRWWMCFLHVVPAAVDHDDELLHSIRSVIHMAATILKP